MSFTLNQVPKQGDTRLIALKKVLMKMQTAGGTFTGNNPKQSDTYRQTLRKVLKSQAGLQ